MRNRNIQLNIRLTQQESATLRRNSKRAGLSQSGYLRMLLCDYVPRPLPPTEYHQLTPQLSELHAFLQSAGRETDAAVLRQTLLALQKAIEAPETVDESCKS